MYDLRWATQRLSLRWLKDRDSCSKTKHEEAADDELRDTKDNQDTTHLSSFIYVFFFFF